MLAAALLLLTAVYLIWFLGRERSSLDPGSAAFAVADTVPIDRIVLTKVVQGTETAQLRLARQPSGAWQANERYQVLRPRISRLLRTLSLLQVKEVLTGDGTATARAILNTVHTRVEIYAGRRRIKAYRLGTETRDARGTLMMLDGSDEPLVVELPGHQGYVNGFYDTDLSAWRENYLFTALADSLQSLRIEYAADSSRNVSLARQPGGWVLMPGGETPDAAQLQAYWAAFTGRVFAESFAEARYPGKLAELRPLPPDIRFTAGYPDGRSREILLYLRSDNPNNYFGWVQGEDELLTIQHFVFDKYLADRRQLSASPLKAQPM